MLEAYNIAPLRVQSKVISNDTADQSLPQDVSKMLSTAVNKIGKEVIYIPFDPNYVISESTTGGNINRTLPQLVIAGGITEYDKDMIEKSRELKSDVQIQKDQWGSSHDWDGGAGYKSGSSVSRIALDLHLLDYRTQASIAGLQTSNAITMRKTSLGWGIGAYFDNCGLSFDYSLRKKQGMYYGIRLLVELSVLEVLGKYFDVPYWRCISGAKPDQGMLNRLREEFGDLTEDEQRSYLKEYLFLHGYKVNRASSNFDQREEQILRQTMGKYKVVSNTELFITLWGSVPIESARKLNRDYNRVQAQARAQQEAAEAKRQEQIRASQQQQAREAARKAAATNQKREVKRQVQPAPKPSSSKSNGKEAPVGFGTTEW
jgi:hypothetical protein